MRRRCALLSVLVAALALGSPAPAQEQDWPNRPVTIVYPFAPGGNDAAVRFLAEALSKKFGQPFIVEIRSGAGGGIGSAQVAKSPPDGYTLLYTAIGPAVLNKLLYKSVSYEDTDFEPVILLADAPQIIVSNPKLGFKSLSELIAFGKSNPGKVTIGHAGAGTMGNLAAALFLARTGVDGSLIGYRGATPAITDVLSGQITAAFPIYVPIAEQATMLAVTSELRMSLLPQVPTARESGVDMVANTWLAMMGPSRMPRGIVDKLNAAMNDYLKSAQGSDAFAKMGLRVLGGPPERLTQTMREDKLMWAPVIRDANIKLD